MRRGATGVALLAGVVMATARPAMGDEGACTKAAESGRHARAQGKLRDARRELLACSAATCPGVVQQECARWASEVLDAMPTIVIDARDRQGHDVGDVTVSVDGEEVAKELDGKAIPLDPGPHTIVLLRRSGELVTETLIAKESVKGRLVQTTFRGGIDPDAPARDIAGHTVWPWAVVALGGLVVVAGVALVATAPELPAGCDKSTKTCASTSPGESQADLDKRRDEAGRAVDAPRIGFVTIGAGALVVAGGLLWHFLEPTEPRNVTHRFTPWVAGGAGGLGMNGTF